MFDHIVQGWDSISYEESCNDGPLFSIEEMKEIIDEWNSMFDTPQIEYAFTV